MTMSSSIYTMTDAEKREGGGEPRGGGGGNSSSHFGVGMDAAQLVYK